MPITLRTASRAEKLHLVTRIYSPVLFSRILKTPAPIASSSIRPYCLHSPTCVPPGQEPLSTLLFSSSNRSPHEGTGPVDMLRS